ncbi:cardiolipin synthase [Roseibacillus ishigakijimensis]|uniref:Cardiolipin synthase n=1 Tax=Roseibacillus ishigakijimensis TaxID=454146 RepID=A0A934RPF7_9BACT|nr:cardiolipin synthase [Roseibacillus ishigakijimensis]MBK1834548.1 cardiolipin synthase [Roseibacillus ishigakijimensis]
MKGLVISGKGLNLWIVDIPQPLLILGLVLLHFIGAAHVLHALFRVRTPSATIAWMISLVTFPWVAIPFYWVFGRNMLRGYVQARKSDDQLLNSQVDALETSIKPHRQEPDRPFLKTAVRLGGMPITRGNDADLLIDGEEIFAHIFEAIATAREYLLIHFYIIKSDRVGQRFKEALLDRAKAGVRVHFLFDELGSHCLPNSYLDELTAAGVECVPFGRTRKWWSRLQLNFRNHRKIIVIDGRDAFIGGVNVGDEYLGRNEHFGNWRDTHLRLRGPAVQAVQLVFLEDWYWATHRIPALDWKCVHEEEDASIAIVPTGPSDERPSFQLLIAEAANTAREKLWIASPYFVPDDGVLTALQTAALRGVDVRILLPEKPDHLLVWLSSFTYYRQTLPYGIRLFRYSDGFMHQKAFLIDNQVAGVGTGNLDNRSLRLNFEITAILTAQEHVYEVAGMFTEDFDCSREVHRDEFLDKPIHFKLAAKLARLLAPIQ